MKINYSKTKIRYKSAKLCQIAHNNISKDTHNLSHINCLLQSFQSCFNCAVTLYCKQFVYVWADTVTLGHLLLKDTSNACYKRSVFEKKKLSVSPWKIYSKVNQLTLSHQMCFPCMQLSSYHSNCIPEPNTHPSLIWHCLFDALCEHVCT